MSPYYRRGAIAIYKGNSLEIAPQINNVQLLLTDPPYGISLDTDYRRFSKPGMAKKPTKHRPVAGDSVAFDPGPWLVYPRVIIWGSNCFSNRLPRGRLLIWDKRFMNGKAFLSQAEAAWMRGGHGVYIYSETCQGFVRKERVCHPTQKSVGLMMWCIKTAKASGMVLDPFMGSGTTLIAAARLSQPCVGIEVDERYCEIAATRLEAELSTL